MLTDITGDHRHFLRYLLMGALGWLTLKGTPEYVHSSPCYNRSVFFVRARSLRAKSNQQVHVKAHTP